MADFSIDSSVEGVNGRFRARISPDWKVWGPLGGYVAAIAFRAIAKASELPRPASFSCHFLAMADFEAVDIEVSSLRRGKRSQALHARLSQNGKPILVATAWMVEDGGRGLDHDYGRMPAVPPPAQVPSYRERARDYSEWYPVWQAAIDGRPVQWADNPKPGPPYWHTWMRLRKGHPIEDPILDAARALLWLDLMMWNAAVPPHMPWPLSYIAPSLDLSVVFHDSALGDEWLLCDAEAPVGRHGLLGCAGRVWSPSGRLIASGNSCLFCVPNPFLEAERERAG